METQVPYMGFKLVGFGKESIFFSRTVHQYVTIPGE